MEVAIVLRARSPFAHSDEEESPSMNVLIVEDHPIVADLTKTRLEMLDPRARPTICTTADAARDALKCASHEWHCILLDLDIPGSTGLSFAREVRSMGMHKRCCVLSGREQAAIVSELYACGFLGFIGKSGSIAVFEEALRSVLNGRQAFPTSLLHGAASIALTARQKQALEMAGGGMSSKQIAASLGGISEGTVNLHINGAMRALGVGKRSLAIAKAVEMGLIRFAGISK